MSNYKFNWGWGILISIIVFLLIMAALIIFSMSKEVDLVTKDYYKNELEYQTQIDKTNESLKLNKEVNLSQNENGLVISFPDSVNIEGELNFYRPSDYKLDFSIPINLLEGNKLSVSKNKFVKGYWKVKISWRENEKDFYSEKTFVIQ